ncbi:MAG: dihydrofolate reductase family protein, partial [Deltaproteobacteria bacterium]|nr:dihydrofolate reductase family protein [Deltaproteobacteria bacterium]
MSLAALDGFFDRAAKKLAATDRPYVTLKAASTLDGRIATSGGESRWITGEESRRAGHLLRRIHSAILVGIRTVEADDPQLTIRLDSWENSLSGLPSSLARVVLDSSCRIAPGSRVLAEDGCRRVVIAGSDAPPEKVEGLRRRGVEVWLCPTPKPEPGFFLPRLRGEGLSSLLVEGGGKVHAGLIAQQEADEVFLFISGWVF